MYDDVPLFLGLISDLFPGLKCSRVTYPELSKAIDQNIKEKHFIPIQNQVIIAKKSYLKFTGNNGTMGILNVTDSF